MENYKTTWRSGIPNQVRRKRKRWYQEANCSSQPNKTVLRSTLQRANANVDENEDGAAEIGDEAVVVVDGPGVACPEQGEIQENNN